MADGILFIWLCLAFVESIRIPWCIAIYHPSSHTHFVALISLGNIPHAEHCATCLQFTCYK